MTFETERLLDETGWHLLQELQENARLSYSELGHRVGLSAPAVAERLRRMEEAGIITGYRVEINPAKIGLPISAIIRMTTLAGERCTGLDAFVKDLPEILECYRTTGNDSLVMKVVVSSVEHLEALIDHLSTRGQLTTSIVLSSPIPKRMLTPMAQTLSSERGGIQPTASRP
jgi:Lrp/AsnC family leucine-responsive transcriptional regulator